MPHTISSVNNISDPYSRRILANILGKDPLKICAQTPKTLGRLLRGLSEKQLHAHPMKGKWSIVQIVSHLYDAELVVGFRYRMALAEPGSPLPAFDQDKWEHHLQYESGNCTKKFGLFMLMREDHVSLLRSLPSAKWKRHGMHAGRGKETVERMLQLIAGHDVNHVKQVRTIRELVKG